MRATGKGSIHDLLGDFVVYRNLTPADERLSGFAKMASRIGLDADCLPRKSEATYGSVVARILCEARKLEEPQDLIQRILYIGDTRMNDGLAFESICRAGRWPGIIFIGSETSEPVKTTVDQKGKRAWVQSNRWSALYEIEEVAGRIDLPIDEHTAVLIDLDKTALGARGRNDAVIDRVRIEAARNTVGALLGEAFDTAAFQSAYERLNQPECHRFTSDNQDYLVYVCLILGCELFSLDAVLTRIREGTLTRFDQFLTEVDGYASQLPEDVQALHLRFHERMEQRDPTPFKAFRCREYAETTARMGFLLDDTPIEQLMKEEITLTKEVYEMAIRWRERGTLLFGLSDKPDEACYPTDEQAVDGLLPLHRMMTHIVGE